MCVAMILPLLFYNLTVGTRDWDSLAMRSCSAPWKPHFVPPNPGSSPLPTSILPPPHSSPYSSSEEDPYPDFSAHCSSPCLEAESCCIDTSLAVTWEKSRVCETCLRRKRGLGYRRSSKTDDRSIPILGRGWMRHIIHHV